MKMNFLKENWQKVLIVIAVFFFYLTPPVDSDLGWHLRYGKNIFENHSVLRTNQISFFLSDYRWSHSNSLYDLIVFIVYQRFGFWGLSILGSLIMVSPLIFIFLTTGKRPFYPAIAAFLIVFISLPATGLGLRSQLFSNLCLSILICLLTSLKRISPTHFAIFPILFLFWANVHGGFILGFAVLFFYLIEKIFLKEFPQALKISLITFLSLMATLLNPFGVEIYKETYRHWWYPLNQIIAEWTPPARLHLLIIIFIAALIITNFLAVSKKSRFFKRKNLVFLGLSWLSFLYLAVKAKRHLPLFAIASCYLIPKVNQLEIEALRSKNHRTLGCNSFNPAESASRRRRWNKTGRLEIILARIITITICLAIIIKRLANLPNLKDGWQYLCQQERMIFPCQTVNYLKSKPGLCPRIFNTYEWGGYLAWHLPESKIFVDGRMSAWPTKEGKSPYTIYLEIIQAQEGFDQRLINYGADCLLIAKGTFLDLELKENQNHPWEIIYQDNRSTIYKQKAI